MDPTTKRVELSGDNWAVLRAGLTVGELRKQRRMVKDRGWTDDVLDGLDLLHFMIQEWSYGPVDEATIDALPLEDVQKISEEIRGLGEAPRPSASSSAGTSSAGSGESLLPSSTS